MASSGQPPYHGDENRQGGILATVFVATILASIVVALRFGTRIWIVRNVGIDDYTILCATLGIIIGCGLVVVQLHYGLGRHKYYLTQWEFIKFMKYSYGEWIQTFQTLMFNKLSICFFLLRIPVEKHFIRPIQGVIAVLIVTNIILTLLWIFQCNPIAGSWNKQTPSTCFTDAQLQRIIISQALISILSDFALALFPIALLWKVQISIRIKAGLCSLMALGLITAACCIVRTVLNWQNVNSDPTWKSIDNWYWRSWEVCIGIIAACIPALRPGYKFVSTGLHSYLSRRSSRTSSTFAPIKERGPLDANSDKEPVAELRENPANKSGSLGEAANAASAEIDSATKYGVGEEGFAMKSLPGDKRTMEPGIKKTTQIDVDSGRQGSLGPDDYAKRRVADTSFRGLPGAGTHDTPKLSKLRMSGARDQNI